MTYFLGVLGLIALVVLGLIGIFSPETLWYLQIGHQFKDSEPTEFALFMHRVEGVFCIGLVIFILFVIFSN